MIKGRGRRLPRRKEQAFQPPLLALRTAFPLRSTVPSSAYSLTLLPLSIAKIILSFQQCVWISVQIPRLAINSHQICEIMHKTITINQTLKIFSFSSFRTMLVSTFQRSCHQNFSFFNKIFIHLLQVQYICTQF